MPWLWQENLNPASERHWSSPRWPDTFTEPYRVYRSGMMVTWFGGVSSFGFQSAEE